MFSSVCWATFGGDRGFKFRGQRFLQNDFNFGLPCRVAPSPCSCVSSRRPPAIGGPVQDLTMQQNTGSGLQQKQPSSVAPLSIISVSYLVSNFFVPGESRLVSLCRNGKEAFSLRSFSRSSCASQSFEEQGAGRGETRGQLTENNELHPAMQCSDPEPKPLSP